MMNLIVLAETKAGEVVEKAATSHNPIVPEPNELVYSLIAFVVLVILFKKFAFPAVTKAMEARTKRISDDLSKAESAKTGAESILAEYKKQLADAKAESNRIIDEARQQAEAVKEAVIANANNEVANLKAKATQDIEAARVAALASLQASVGAIAIELAEKVVERNLDRDTNQRLIDSFINKVGS